MAEAKYFPIVINKNRNFCIDVSGGNGNCKNGTKIQLYQYHGGNNQKWWYDGSYIRSAVNSNYVIDVQYSKFQNGTKLQVWKWNGSKAQQWDFINNEIVSRGNRKYCIDLDCAHVTINHAIKNNQKIHLVERRKGGHPAQKWSWLRRRAAPAPRVTKPVEPVVKHHVIEFVGVDWFIIDTILAQESRTMTVKTGFNDGSQTENESTSGIESSRSDSRSKTQTRSRSKTQKDSFEWSVDAKASGGICGAKFEASAHTGGANSTETNNSSATETNNSSASASQVSKLTRKLNTATKTVFGEQTETRSFGALPHDTYIMIARIEGKLGNQNVYIQTACFRRWNCDNKKSKPQLPPIEMLL